MQRILAKIDQFGAEEKLSIHPVDPIQKSVFGGIMTLILYGASLAYFLSEIINWAQNNKLPKITTYRKQIDESETVELSGRIFEISYYQWAEGDIDPFDPQNLIFYPNVSQLMGSLQNITVKPIKFEQIKLENGNIKNTFYLEDQQIVGSPPNGQTYNKFVDYQIAIGLCNQNNLPLEYKCADDSRSKKYFEQVNYFTMVFYIEGYDSKSKTLSKIPKHHQMRIGEDDADFYQFSLKLSDTQNDDGILFNNYNKFSFISDFSVATYKIDLPQTVKQFGEVSYLIAYITLDQIKEEVLIEYAKISEILADTGSIISWILQISFFVLKYNEKICSDRTIKEVIKLYYPDFEDLKVSYNFFGKLHFASIQDKKYDPEKINLLLKQLSSIAQQKVNFINLQYEVYRLQTAITKTLGLNCFKMDDSEKKLEAFIDNLGYRVEQPLDNSSINILPQQQAKHSQILIFDSIEHDLNNFGSDMIESTIGLFHKQSQVTKQKVKEIEKEIFPKEELKAEDISRINSQR